MSPLKYSQLRKVENGWIVSPMEPFQGLGQLTATSEWVFPTIEEAAAKIKELSGTEIDKEPM